MVSRFQQWLRRLSAYPVGFEATAQATEAMAAETRGVSIQGNVQTVSSSPVMATPSTTGQRSATRLSLWRRIVAPWPRVVVIYRSGVPQAAARHLWDFIVTDLAAQNLEYVTAPLQDALEHGHAVLLLDGLNEIPTLA